jgi:hypothetical protein
MFADTIRAAVPSRVRCFSPASPRAAPSSVWQRLSICSRRENLRPPSGPRLD